MKWHSLPFYGSRHRTVCESDLEVVTERDLEQARVTDGGRNLSERLGSGDAVTRDREIHIVEQVEGLATEGDDVLFPEEGEALGEREVGVEETRSAEGIAARGSEFTSAGKVKGDLIG
jgi:hypothetical protein